MSYNGWSNYATWCVHLWLSNEKGSYYAAREVVASDWDADNAYRSARALRDFVESECVDAGDLLGAALSEVDWEELATAFAPESDEDESDADDSEPVTVQS